MARVMIATTRPWNIRRYERWASTTPHATALISERDQLTADYVRQFSPDFVFFPHWSWHIPREVYGQCECVVFHMTDLPFGRGGSPLQNLISRGIYETQLCAVRVEDAIDAGPVYLRRPLCLEGTAEEIYDRASQLTFDMIDVIAAERPIPSPQVGDVVEFQRRSPEQSVVPDNLSTRGLFDFIRMLDATGYPAAYFDRAGFRYTFRRPASRDGGIVADVTISPLTKDSE